MLQICTLVDWKPFLRDIYYFRGYEWFHSIRFQHTTILLHHACRVLSNKRSDNVADSLSVASLFDELPYTRILQKHPVTKLQIERLVNYLEQYEQSKNMLSFTPMRICGVQ